MQEVFLKYLQLDRIAYNLIRLIATAQRFNGSRDKNIFSLLFNRYNNS